MGVKQPNSPPEQPAWDESTQGRRPTSPPPPPVGRKTAVPGVCVLRKTISDECRLNHHLDVNVRDIVLRELQTAMDKLMYSTPVGDGWKMHVVLTVERPEGLMP